MYTDDKIYFDNPSSAISLNKVSQNWVDLGVATYGSGIDVTRGRSLRAQFRVTTAPTNTVGWVQIQLVATSNVTIFDKNYIGITSNTGASAVFTFVGHGLNTGLAVRFTSFTGATGVTAERIYYARYASADTFSLHTSYAGAAADTGRVDPATAMSAGVMKVEPLCVASSGILDAAALTLGTTIDLKFNPPPKYNVDFAVTGDADKTIVQYEGNGYGARFIVARYITGGTVAGLQFTSYILLDAQDGHKHHPSGFTV